MQRTRRTQTGAPDAVAQAPARPPVDRQGAGGYHYRLHSDGRVEIVRSGGSIFVTEESNATAYNAIIAEVGAYPELAVEEDVSETPFLDGVESEQDAAEAEAIVPEAQQVVSEQAPERRTGVGASVRRESRERRAEEGAARRAEEGPEQSDDRGWLQWASDALFGKEAQAAELEVQAPSPENRDVHAMDRKQLAAILAAPETYGFSMWAAAHARDRMLEHQEAVDATGVGTIEGIHTEDKTEGAEREDCTTFVLETLGAAFASAGETALWNQVKSQASRNSGSGGFKGIELMKALQNRAGWKSLFWAPDTKKSADEDAEHTFAASVAARKGTYYGAEVDKDMAVTNYRRTDETAEADFTGLDKLKEVPVGVLAARGGMHMALMINGAVYEVHWDYDAGNRNAVEATPLENWPWLSGMVTAPAADLDKAFGA